MMNNIIEGIKDRLEIRQRIGFEKRIATGEKECIMT